MASSILKRLVSTGTTGSWRYVRILDYVIMTQQFAITPTASRVTTNREIDLPFTMAANNSYHIQMTPNSRVEADVFNYGAQRTSASKITIHVFSTSTAEKSFFVSVLGKVAS